MARPREFDTEAVVRQAMEVFWRRGYAATAMSDIYEATGLKPGSVYAAFGDKETLFQRAFAAYARHFRATLPTGPTGLPAIRAWLDAQVRLATEDPERRGCLIVNTVMEREVHSEATRALAQGRLQEIRDFFVEHVALAVRDGALPDGTAVPAKADALLGAVVAIMSLGRAGADRTTIAHVAEGAIAALNPTPHS
ncbi:TetR/AcrR family transcriptional regulator [Roseomonas sp. F4]